MKKTVLIFGAISGLITVSWFLIAMTVFSHELDMNLGMILGYASMLIANAFLVVGVKNYRDKYNGGVISFGKAFQAGLLITLIGSTIYVGSWLIYYYTAGNDFMNHYIEFTRKELVASGMSAAEITRQVNELKDFAISYQNPFFNAAMTYMEILPMGLLFTVITAFALRRKVPKTINTREYFMAKHAAGRMFQDFSFTVKAAKGKKLEQLIGVENPENPDAGQILIYIKMEGISWSQYFLDVCFGVWENWGEIDLKDEAYVYPDYGKQFQLENKILKSVSCKECEIILEFETGEKFVLKYKNPDDWDGDTEVVRI